MPARRIPQSVSSSPPAPRAPRDRREIAFEAARAALAVAQAKAVEMTAAVADLRTALSRAEEANLSQLALTVQHAAQLLDMDSATLRRLIADGEIRAIRIHRGMRVPLRELEAYIGERLDT